MPLPNPSVADAASQRNFQDLDKRLAGYSTAINSVYRTILLGSTTLARDRAAGTILLGQRGTNATQGDTAYVSGADAINTGIVAAPLIIYFDDADYRVTNKAQKLRVRAQVAVNATAATMNFTTGLYPVTVAGAADTLTITAGTVVAGSTVAINSPSASTVTQGNSGDFAIPADGAYCLGVVTSNALTNNCAVLVSAQLQTRNV